MVGKAGHEGRDNPIRKKQISGAKKTFQVKLSKGRGTKKKSGAKKKEAKKNAKGEEAPVN